jgi:hypothetical protein
MTVGAERLEIVGIIVFMISINVVYIQLTRVNGYESACSACSALCVSVCPSISQ